MGFLYRAVLRSEFLGGTWDEQAGYAFFTAGEALWLAVWDCALAGDAESLVKASLSQAGDKDIAFAGALVVAEGAAFQDTSEAMFVYGYEQSSSTPNMVQVLGKPAWRKPPKGVTIVEAKNPAAAPDGYMSDAIDSDGMAGPVSRGRSIALLGRQMEAHPTERLLLAYEGEQMVGSVLVVTDGPVGRIVELWVSPAHRKRGIGAALVEYGAHQITSNGCPAVTAWTSDSGLLRYYFPKLGFLQQLTLACFLPSPGQ